MALVVVLAVLAGENTQARAALKLTKVEAETMSPSGACWWSISKARLSGGAGRYCHSPNVPLTWTVNIPPNERGVIRLYGYRDPYARGFRVRIDDGVWSEGALRGETSYSTIFFTSPVLAAGTHRFELEQVDLAGSFTLDFYQLETSPTLDGPPLQSNTCNITPSDGQQAITAAIESCPEGSTVLFPSNQTYHQTEEILVKQRSNLVIDGNGSTFMKTSPSDPNLSNPNWTLLEVRNVVLQNMTIRGAFTDPPSPRNSEPIPKPNQLDHGVMIFGGSDIIVRDVFVSHVFGDFVGANSSGLYRDHSVVQGEMPRNVRVERLHGEHAARSCVQWTGTGLWLLDSYLEDCRENAVSMEIHVPSEPVQDVHILRNTISGYYFSAISVSKSGYLGKVDRVEIKGNETLTPSDTCMPPVFIGYWRKWGTFTNIVTEDNNLKALNDGIVYRDVASGAIRNNRIEKVASRCSPHPEPVVLENSSNAVVSGNTAVGYEPETTSSSMRMGSAQFASAVPSSSQR